MYIFQKDSLSDNSLCDYLRDRDWRFRYFFAMDLNGEELRALLSKGWRKFGYYYFRPECIGCLECIPLRVSAMDFRPSRNQREVLKRNRNVRVEFGPLRFSERVFEIYDNHSHVRFDSLRSRDDFLFNFYTPSCPSLQSEYYVGDVLAGVGFLDVSSDGLSSVYFMYDTEYSKYSLGTYSAIREIEYAVMLGLPYYYLGYYIAQCPRMSYKARFRPYELYDWNEDMWRTVP